jgi:single-strand DNA-binding protein
MNSVNLIGRLGGDPEMQYTADGTAVTKFSVAVDRYKREEPDWFDVTVFGKVAESTAQYMRKGMEVGVSGRLQQDKWTNDAGENRSRVLIVAQQVDFLTKKGDAT